ncbi:tripartite tricarboxylate transporter substrate binding protein [Roseomonas terrae]|uniref:Tripartite tricarboxylate transporter substrate binding protein n=1 Tax=Neoroseomonas terrae TaxID=424799 RepID=A0ABS5EQ62_9PROT|nr:tripartite tricarboxylate transporter substrate binding protein [Neoroseomonas terrae]
MLADRLSVAWKQPVVVEARPGASGTIAAGVVARAAPDGYTLGLVASTHAVAPLLIPRLPFSVQRDFTPIAQVVSHPLILVVHPSSPARTVQELIALARQRRGELTMGTVGVGTSFHLAAAQLAVQAGVQFTYVPYNGASTAQTAIIRGEVDALFQNPLLAVPAVRDDGLRALGTSGTHRWRDLPDVPTIAEAGFPGYEAKVWYGFLGPASLPADLLARIADSIQAAMEIPEVQARLQASGFEPSYVGPAAFGRIIEEDFERWGHVIRAAGIQGVE